MFSPHIGIVYIYREYSPLNTTILYYFHDKKTIQINSDIRDRALLATIRHEMMEASLLLSGVGFLESYEQEAVVRCMEEIFFPAWAQFLKRIKFKDI